MLKALISKQFTELFRGYFVNRKTGKARSKGKIAGLFVLFALLMAVLALVFGALSFLLADGLLAVDAGWLYFTLLGLISVALGTFGSVFNTYAGLYLAKDNDLLLSMPVKPSAILFTRLIGVYAMSLLYSGIVWAPACAVYQIMNGFAGTALLYEILLLFIIAFFVTVLVCLLGWLVALFSSRVKKKSVITVILSLLFFAVYYFVCFRMNDLIGSLISNSEQVGETLNTWARLMCDLGRGACGETRGMLIFTLVTAVLSAACFTVMSRTFIRIALRGGADTGNRKRYSIRTEKQTGLYAALYKKEARRFVSSSVYMLNCGIGLVMLMAAAVLLFINRGSIGPVLEQFSTLSPWLENISLPACMLLIGLISAMDIISTPSVSLEGKSLWILRSMPVSSKQILRSKLLFHISINALPCAVSAVLLALAFSLPAVSMAVLLLYSVLFQVMIGLIGLIIGTAKADFKWTSETYPIKQSTSVIIVMALGWLSVMIFSAAVFLLVRLIPVWAAGIAVLALVLAVCAVLMKVMESTSAKLLDRL